MYALRHQREMPMRCPVAFAQALMILLVPTCLLAGAPYFTDSDTISHGSSASTPEMMVSGDFNQDGDQDLVVYFDYQNDIYYYENNRTYPPTFTRTLAKGYSTPIKVMRTADLDKNGFPDLTVQFESTSQIIVLFNLPSGGVPSFSAKTATISSFTTGLRDHALGDINGDGYLDIVGVDDRDDRIAWVENPGDAVNNWTFHLISDDPDAPGSGADGPVDKPTSVRIGDMDSDGDNDIIMGSDSSSAGLYYYENDGSATPGFTLRTSYTSTGIDRIEVADYNLDGQLDIAVADLDSGWIRIRINDGTPSNGTSETIFVSASGTAQDLTGLHSIDVDRDGFLDLLVVRGNTSAPFSYFVSNGDRSNLGFASVDLTFSPIFKSTEAQDLRSSVFMDIDNDCDLDLLAGEGVYSGSGIDPSELFRFTNFSYHRQLWFEAPAPTAATNMQNPVKIEKGDVNGDGLLDMVVASIDDDAIWVLLNSSSSPGTFTKIDTFNTGTDPEDVSIDDIDGDGDLDIAYASSGGSGRAAWLENNGSSTPSFTDNSIIGLPGNHQVESGDLDGDGDIDVAITGSYNSAGTDFGYLIWYQNNGAADPSFTQRTVALTGIDQVESLEIADLDGDGDLDMAAYHKVDSTTINASIVSWYENNGSSIPTFNSQTITASLGALTNAGSKVTAGDLDNDGDMDLVLALSGTNSIGWMKNDGAADPTFTYQIGKTSIDTPREARVADVDCDGDMDILTTASNEFDALVLLNNGLASPSFTRTSLTNLVENAPDIVAGDFFNHGRMDIAVPSSDSDWVLMFKEIGGDYDMQVVKLAPKYVFPGHEAAVLRADIEHLGRSSDAELEIVRFTIQFTDVLGNPQTLASVRDQYSSVKLYADNGDGVFDAGDDSLMRSSAIVNSSSTTFSFTVDSDPERYIAPGQTKMYFVTVTCTDDAYQGAFGTHAVELVEHDFEIGQYRSYPQLHRPDRDLSSGGYSFYYNMTIGTDTDGDGFTDESERYFSSDEGDPSSHPPVGDYNLDGSTNMSDAIELARDFAAGTVNDKQAFDVNGDYIVDRADAWTIYYWSIGQKDYEVLPNP